MITRSTGNALQVLRPSVRVSLRPLDAPLLVLVALHPIVDAFHEVEIVKYSYMAGVLVTGMLAILGRFSGQALMAQDRSPKIPLGVGCVALAYLSYLVLLCMWRNGEIKDALKIVSPFFVYIILAGTLSTHTGMAILVSSILVIGVNSVLLAYPDAWIHWGSVLTFRGFYFFKTDLAYAVTTALLAVAICLRFRRGILLITSLIAATVLVVLSNSRLNYLLLAIAALFILVQQQRTLVSLRFLFVPAVLGCIAFALYDSERFLSPVQFEDTGSFTQGRDYVWHLLIDYGLKQNSALSWFVGNGLSADVLIAAKYSDEIRIGNAHNEYIFLLLNQGVLGSALYASCWAFLLHHALRYSRSAVARSTAVCLLGLLMLQGMTANVSLFASKTWPIVFGLVACMSVFPLTTQARLRSFARRSAHEVRVRNH